MHLHEKNILARGGQSAENKRPIVKNHKINIIFIIKKLATEFLKMNLL